MKSDVIMIDNQGKGFSDAIEETKKVAEFKGLSGKNALQLQLLAEEMLNMARIVTGEMKASFWLESENGKFDLNMTTNTTLDKEKRYQLISSSTARKNEAANSFLGKLRDAFEEAMTANAEPAPELPEDVLMDIGGRAVESSEWDQYEQSVLRKLADEVKIWIRGGLVHLTVSKTFA